MSDSTQDVQLSTFVLCRECLQNEDVLWSCKSCNTSVCIHCKLKHLEANPSHEFVVHNQEDDVLEYSVGECEEHRGEDLKRFCHRCRSVCCPSCIISSHADHDVQSVYETIKFLRFQMVELLRELSQQLIVIEDAIRTWARKASEFFDVLRYRRNQIINRFSEFETLPELNKILIDLLQMYDQDHKQEVGDIQAVRLELDQKHAVVKSMISESEDVLKTDDAGFILNARSIIDRRDDKLSMFSALNVPIPTCKEIDMRSIDKKINPFAKMLEKNHIELQILYSFSVDFTPHQVIPISPHRAWIGASPRGRLTHVSVSGEDLETADTCFKIQDFRIQANGDFIFSLADWTTYCLKRITFKERIRVSVIVDDFTPFESRGICINDLNQIVVCLVGPHGKLGVYNLNCGTKVFEIRKKAFGISLFTSPTKVTQNYNGDYHVIDEKDHTIVTVNRNGVYLWTYDGRQGEMSGMGFCPKDICCDRYLNVIISDFNNDVIHIVNRYGQYVTNLDTRSSGISGVHAISIDNQSKLWLSTYFQKKIFVLEYLRDRRDITHDVEG